MTAAVKIAFSRAGIPTLKVSLMMLKVFIPLSLLTVVLRELGLISLIAPLFAPVTTLLGLPGEAAITLLAGFTNTIYAALATAAALDLTPRQITILGVVLGIAHSLFVETGILTNLRMATIRIALFRIAVGLVSGMIMHALMPAEISGVVLQPALQGGPFSWSAAVLQIGVTSVQIVLIIFSITFLYELIAGWRHIDAVKSRFTGLTAGVGMTDRALAPWLVGFFVGITYGAAMLYQFVENRQLSHKDACLITVFLCLAHAIIEDTMLFVVVGGNFWWILLTRVIMAVLVVRLLATNNLYQKLLWIGLPKEPSGCNRDIDR